MSKGETKEMVQSVKCLPYKHEDLNSDPQYHIKAVLGRQTQEDPRGLQDRQSRPEVHNLPNAGNC